MKIKINEAYGQYIRISKKEAERRFKERKPLYMCEAFDISSLAPLNYEYVSKDKTLNYVINIMKEGFERYEYPWYFKKEQSK